jgi:oxaloacetate decarboxylase (Na+ extruding) subunit alpha
MPRLRITDLTLRDAHQSLFATRMLTDDMLPIAGKLNSAGFWSLETWGGATFDTCIRFLNEDPWERLTALHRAMPDTRQQMLLRGQNLLGYRHYADDVIEAFVEEAALSGVEVFRVFDALNDPRNLATSIRAVRKAGKHVQAAISFAVSPVHTVESYVDLAAEFAGLGADSICLKDMAGLLKPFDAVDLTRAIKARVDLPLQIHSHATTGMSVAALVKAVEAGADGVDTAISSMSMGTSHSPTETIVEIFRGTSYDTGIDLPLLLEIAAYFRDVRRKYKSFESAFFGADTRILASQVPGGMMSNLESQLREQGAGDRMDAVLDEIAVVQKDFGYPPLVTPTSQIVGTQAVLNVLFGRYQRLSTESRNLLTGLYGATPAPAEPALVKKALEESKMEKAMTARPADSIPAEFSKLEKELADKLGVRNPPRRDVLTYALFPQVALTFFASRDRGPVRMTDPTEKPSTAPVAAPASGPCTLSVDGRTYEVDSSPAADGSLTVTVDGQAYSVSLGDAPASTVPFSPVQAKIPAPPVSATAPKTPVHAPMPGTIIKLLKKDGDAVAINEPVVTIEAMKMEMEIRTPVAGRIRYEVKTGEVVQVKEILAEVTP